jgi:hypothetical protein
MDNKDKPGDYFLHSFSLISSLNPEAISQDDYYEICLETLKIDGKYLERVEPGRFTAEQYTTLCFTAVEQNAFALEWAEESGMKVEDYQNLCYEAARQNGFSVYFVKRECFQNNPRGLRVIYNVAVSQNTAALQLIQDQTLPLCLMAVKKNARALQWVNPNLFSKVEYGEICHQAFYQKQANILLARVFGDYFDIKYIQDYQALRFVCKGHLLARKYKLVCLQAIQYSADSLPFVDKSLWLDKGFCMAAMKISRAAKIYISSLT